MRIHSPILTCLISLVAIAAQAQSAPGAPTTSARVVFDPASHPMLDLHMVRAEPVIYRGKSAMRVTPDESVQLQGYSGTEAIAIIPGSAFQDGVIELEVAGMPGVGADTSNRGFVGLAFRTSDDRTRFEYLYLRPTNGRAEDQLRRNHSTQYASYPDYPWHRLRRESPGKYESYVDLEAGAWTPIRIEVQGSRARLYVHGSAQPVLIVNDLKHGPGRGNLALWVGQGTEAHFSRISIME
jgi:hypothetical protein